MRRYPSAHAPRAAWQPPADGSNLQLQQLDMPGAPCIGVDKVYAVCTDPVSVTAVVQRTGRLRCLDCSSSKGCRHVKAIVGTGDEDGDAQAHAPAEEAWQPGHADAQRLEAALLRFLTSTGATHVSSVSQVMLVYDLS